MKIFNFQFSIFNFRDGFTLLEILIAVGIVAILAALAFPALHNFQLTSGLENSADELINTLRLAQQKTTASEGLSSWGVYFNASTSPHRYILFQGDNYSSRDVSKDEVHEISGAVLISEINLGGPREAVFNQISGVSFQQGSVVLALKADPSQIKTIYIESSGQVGLTAPIAPSDNNRIKDSRHVHIDYSRYISTSTESLILTFYYDSSTQIETIPIGDWQGEFNVGDRIQKLKIKIHRLNQPDTQISVRRDRRYNDRALKIKFSGDSSGNFVEYSADGLNTINTSIYVTNLQWQ